MPALPRILVVDDDRINLLIMSSALETAFEVIQATSGSEALDRAAHGDIDLLLGSALDGVWRSGSLRTFASLSR